MNDTIFDIKAPILVTCPKRITPYLADEITQLGFAVKESHVAGVELEGSVNDCIKLNLNLRTGHRVLYFIGKFKANNPDELYQGINAIPWENFISEDGYFSVISRVENETINNETFASLKTKDGIVDRFSKLFNKRPDSGPDKSKTVIFLHWKKEEVLVYLDTSGEGLAKHGYRKMPFKAPLQETLAAAIILVSKWDRKSSFINPMCGSGTLAIEAALIAADRKPGLYRSNYGFMHIKGYNDEVYKDLRQEMKNQVKKTSAKIIASDNDPRAIQAAKQNAATAGVDHMIEFIECDFEETPIPEEEGVVFLNPEYGERLGQESELEDVYKSIGDFFKQKCKGYTGYIFTGNLQLAKKIGLKTKRRIEFYNSTIDCRLLEFELYQGSKRLPLNLKQETL